jgi:ribosome-binding protein aMBF1 (putative translation factor)
MTKGKKTYAKIRKEFSRDFEDAEFKILFEEERARSEIALAITKARKAAGLTQAQLAEKIDTTQSVIARLESGSDDRMPSLSLLARIASATGKHLILGFEAAEKKAG